MKETLDRETELTYEAEHEVWGYLVAPTGFTVEEARLTAVDLCGSGFYVVPYATVKDFWKKIRRRSFRCGEFRPATSQYVAHVAVDFDSPLAFLYLLHELAHAKAYFDREPYGHTAEFRRNHVGLLRRVYGDDVADKMMKSYRDKGLRVAGPRKTL